MSSGAGLTGIRAELKNLSNRIKRVEDALQFSPTVVSFDWDDFSDLDKRILDALLIKGRRGETTTKLAVALDVREPETSGRVVVYRRLRRIERISRKIKGFPIVIYETKKWSLNYTDFQFIIKKDEEEE